MESKPFKEKLIGFAKIVVSVVLLYYAISNISTEQLLSLWSEISLFYLILSTFLFLLSQLLSTARLNIYFESNGIRLDYWTNAKLYLVGMFYNFFIPGGIGGDAYKVYSLKQHLGYGIKKSGFALLMDRFNGFTAILVLIGVGVAFIVPTLRSYLLVFGLVLFFLAYLLKYFNRFSTTQTLLHVKAFVLSIFIQVLQAGSFIVLAKGLGIDDKYVEYCVLFLSSSILSLISFAGIGAREVLFLETSQYFQIDPQASIAASLLFTFITASVSIFGLYYHFKSPLKQKLK